MAYMLYPRLPGPAADQRIAALRAAPIESLPDNDPRNLQLDAYVYSATGGQRVDRDHLLELRSGLVGVAEQHGFPEPPDRANSQGFDSAAARALQARMQITPNEATRRGLWPFLCCELVPELVRWRFPGQGGTTASERFGDGVRNTFGRLWWRAHILVDPEHTDRRDVLDHLGEDEVVQLMERPGMRANVALTRAVADRFIDTIEADTELQRMLLMREVQKRLMRLQPVVCFESLDQADLEALVDRAFSEATMSLRARQADQPARPARPRRRSWLSRLRGREKA